MLTHDVVAALAGRFDQPPMTLVQRAHRRHEPDALSRAAAVIPPRADARDGPGDFRAH